MLPKDCGKHENKWLKLFWRLFPFVLTVIILVLLIILIIWLVLRPTHPRFVLQDVVILQFNATAATSLTTAMQVSLAARNPNNRIGVYYDRLDVYATYRNQQVTLATCLPPSYQGHDEITVWSPYLNGVNVPASPFLVLAVQQDQSSGYLVVSVKADGRVRWKVGTWVSGHYPLYVKCFAYFRLDGRPTSDNALVRLQFPVGCSVRRLT